MSDPTAIEEHLAHNTAAIDDISEQMTRQWAAIRRLEAQVDRLAGLIHAMERDSDAPPPDDTPPPHY